MQMRESRWTINIFRVTGFSRDSAVEGLPDLANHNKIVHRALA